MYSFYVTSCSQHGLGWRLGRFQKSLIQHRCSKTSDLVDAFGTQTISTVGWVVNDVGKHNTRQLCDLTRPGHHVGGWTSAYPRQSMSVPVGSLDLSLLYGYSRPWRSFRDCFPALSRTNKWELPAPAASLSPPPAQSDTISGISSGRSILVSVAARLERPQRTTSEGHSKGCPTRIRF